MATLGAFFDANVLYPSGLRNFLMHLALTGIFRAHWSDEVHKGWIRNLLKNRPDLSRDKLERTRQLVDMAIPDALVTGYEHLIDSIELPDRDDRHVVAAAIRGGAGVIVTRNLADFPTHALRNVQFIANSFQSPYFYRASGLAQIAVSAVLRTSSADARKFSQRSTADTALEISYSLRILDWTKHD